MLNTQEIVGEHYLKVPVVQRKDYRILLEAHLEGTFIHCDVHNWSKQVARALAADFQCLCEIHGGPIHALHDSRDRKHENFLKFYGFERLKALDNSEEIWIWNNNG